MPTAFRRLNVGWNAERNAPYERAKVDGDDLLLEFIVNPWKYPAFARREVGRLTFTQCRRYRFTDVNDEAWHRGNCRFSKLAPAWGEFYQVSGDLLDEREGAQWITLPSRSDAVPRRYVFYFRDTMFECDAGAWRFEARTRDGTLFTAR